MVFSNIFGFLAVNLAPKWTETVNFSWIPFEPKFKILKDFSNTVFFLLETTYGKSFSKIKQYLGAHEIAHFMDTESFQKTLKIFNFTTTYAILMRLTKDTYLNKVFYWAKSCGVSRRV